MKCQSVQKKKMHNRLQKQKVIKHGTVAFPKMKKKKEALNS